MPFSQLGLNEDLLRAVQTAGYIQPTSIQSRAIPAILTGKDLIGTAQTGTGKTAAFVLPLLQRLGSSTGRLRAMILTPTRELAQQVEQAIQVYSRFQRFQVLAIYGGVSQSSQERSLKRGVDIVVATPGRLLDLSGQGLIQWSGIELFVLDEADRMMDMGFLPDIRKVVKCLPQLRQTLLFSATIPPEIRELARSIQKEAVFLNVGLTTTPAAGVEQRLFPVPSQQKSSLLVHLLKREQIDTLLVFTRTKHGADRLCRTLQREQFKAAAIHSGRTQSQRQQAMEGFRNGKHQILIATDIAARGIDIPNISHVINYDIPNTADDYIHRIGRTGRAERQGMAYTFVAPEDESTIKGMEKTFSRNLTRIKLEDFSYDASPQLERVAPGSPSFYQPFSGHPLGKKSPERKSGIRRSGAGRHKSNPDSAPAHSPCRMKDSGQFAAQEDYSRRLLDSLAADNPRGNEPFLKRGKFRTPRKSKPQFRW